MTQKIILYEVIAVGTSHPLNMFNLQLKINLERDRKDNNEKYVAVK
jgi:hypothetical protein